METVRNLLYLGIWVTTWSPNTADFSSAPTPENIRWVSLDFTTILTWTVLPPEHPNYTFNVLFSVDDGDWMESSDCLQIFESQCDLTGQLRPLDRSYHADIQTEPLDMDGNYDPDTLPHTYSSKFNPYKQSNISAAKFFLVDVDKKTVMVNISDPLTALHQNGKQLSIRDVLKNDLKYKISYSKSGSTGKRAIISDTSTVTVSGLDAGENYCFMVAAFIPSRSKNSQQGAWSTQLCTDKHKHVLQDLSLGAWVGAVFIGLTVLIIIVSVTVLCCRGRHQRNKTVQQTSQTSTHV
ncbi:tissue factor-like [Xenentodon cancila]